MRTKFPRTFISLHDRISSVRNFCIRPTPLSQSSLLSEIGSKKSNDLTKAKLKMRIVRVLKDNETIRVMYNVSVSIVFSSETCDGVECAAKMHMNYITRSAMA